jgi:hypothetical protein
VFFDGLNGEGYRFTAVDMTNQRALTARSGIVVVAKDSRTPVYIGYAASICTHVVRTNLWDSARHTYGATQVYVLPSGNAAWCERAVENLKARHKPAMNGG